MATDATTPAELPRSVTASFTNSEHRAVKVSVSDMAQEKVTVLTNFKAHGIPTKIRRQLERNGQCQVFDGNKTEIWTAGHDTTSMTKYGRDLRTSEFCRVAGQWIRAYCKNPSKIEEQPPVTQTVPGKTIFVNSRSKTTVKLHAEADATAACNVAGASASAKGHGVADATVKLSTLVKSLKGGADSVSVRLYEQASGKASASASAQANCDSNSTETITVTPGGETPPPVENPKFPPNVNVDNPNHVDTNGVIAFCERESDKDGTIVDRQFTVVSGGGNFLTDPYPGNDPGEWCEDYRGPSTERDDIVLKVVVTDNDAKTASAQSSPFFSQTLPR